MLLFIEHMPSSVLEALHYFKFSQQCYKIIDHIIMEVQGWWHWHLIPLNSE